ncbi:MAG: ORC-CDC6 family AAA ATPase [Sulfurovaceae bacterium]
MAKLSTVFAKNRAEELPNDVWTRYILPINYDGYNVLNFSKSSIIVGERGSGKTMFLKYHCYATMFSNLKTNIEKKDFANIGLYWRPDTDFANLISKKYLNDAWRSAFNVYVVLSLFIEFSKMISVICNSSYQDIAFKNKLKELSIPKEILELFIEEDLNIKVLDFHRNCQFYRSKLNDWLNYPEGKPPFVIGALEKIKLFIDTVFLELEEFKDTTFHIFIDEFENLNNEQQILINGWLKHSQNPLIFHIAHKKDASVSKDTESAEKIVPVNDFRTIDLEEMYKDDFAFLAAEIIHSKLGEYFHNYTIYDLSDIGQISKRKEDSYRDKIRKEVNKVFPSLTLKEVVEEMFNDISLTNKIKDTIKQAIADNKKYSYLDFFNEENKEESIINAILLHRDKISMDDLSVEFKSLSQEFYRDYINNNLVGAILYFYNIYNSKVSPYYAGFDRFILLSQNNIRHLLELCHQSIIQYEKLNEDYNEDFFIDINLQAVAAKRTSKIQIDKVAGLGKYGKDLQRIAIRLGKLFRLHQNRPSQSVAEVNHFAIKGFEIQLTENDNISILLKEAKVWGLLKEEPNNKKTGENDNSTSLFILHPIFSVYFGISPRRKRKLDLTYNQAKTIFIENEDKFKTLYDTFVKKLKLDTTSENYSLLDYINEY